MHILLKQFHDSRDDAAQSRLPRDTEAGLTLVEMIVVLAIIALVAALIVPNVIGRPDEARVTVANTDIRTISAALKMYRLDNGDYPTTAQGLKALAEKPSTPPIPSNWSGDGYLGEVPADPWGNPYQYSAEGGTFTLKSLGKDGKPGGEGLDADLDGKK
ncbi:type II secretion system major pseudopilin GspG [Sphingomonas sp. Y38-1Y]|uniref:type II secretion system major pseudopilin GspG n=1 Tax=Sphingomonas sp. Y38-1Y TaxID=3078265 RepID=UPI0028E4A505|nr:type II secretion system major pseudopilin GspG [Sphingomonas sp. Y38-1Y]